MTDFLDELLFSNLLYTCRCTQIRSKEFFAACGASPLFREPKCLKAISPSGFRKAWQPFTSKGIARFHARFPKIRLTFTTCAHEGLQKDLRKGVTDLAFLLTEGIQAGDLETKILGFKKIVMVAAPHHSLASKSNLQTKHLAGESLLFSKVDCSYRRILEETLKREKILVEKTVTFQSVTTLKACIMAGVGISILPETAVSSEIAEGKLVVLPCEEGTFEVAILMIWCKERWLSPSLQQFMKMASDAIRKVT